MSKLIFLLLCYNLHLNLAEYEPPRSAEYPFGDEELNTDINEGRFSEEFKPIFIDTFTEIEKPCPVTLRKEESGQAGAAVPSSNQKCQKCDIRPTVDKTGVLLECFNCTDVLELMDPKDEAEFCLLDEEDTCPLELDDTEEDILFLATFLEITNYTASDSAQ